MTQQKKPNNKFFSRDDYYKMLDQMLTLPGQTNAPSESPIIKRLKESTKRNMPNARH